MKRAAWFCQDCRVMMHYDKQKDFYECPQCGIEVWPKERQQAAKDEVLCLMRDLAPTHRSTEILPAGPPARGSGSKNRARSRKSDSKKKSLAQINRGLNGLSTAF